MSSPTTKLYDEWGSFTAIPNDVIKMCPALGADGMTIFVYLRYRTNSESGVAFPSMDTIQEDTGVTRKRIVKAIRQMEDLKLMTRQKRFGQSTIYTLKRPPVEPTISISADVALMGKGTAISAASAPSVVQGVHTIKTDLNKTDLNKTDPGADKAPRPRDLIFEAIAQVTHTDPQTAGPSIGKIKSILLKASPPYTPEEVYEFGRQWPKWKERPPTLWQLKEQIGIVRNGAKHGANPNHPAKNEPTYTPEQLAAAAAINAARAAKQAGL